MNTPEKNLSPHFCEPVIRGLQLAVRLHLETLLNNDYRYTPAYRERLYIRGDSTIEYSDLSEQTLKIPQMAVILLEVADFLQENNSKVESILLGNMIVQLPDEYPHTYPNYSGNDTDIFKERAITHSAFCLAKAFELLKSKIMQSQTGLYHALFLKTCLMLEREQVPPNFILGDQYIGLDWMTFIRRYMAPEDVQDNVDAGINIDIQGLDDYPELQKEIYTLYGNLFEGGLYINKLSERIKNMNR